MVSNKNSYFAVACRRF